MGTAPSNHEKDTDILPDTVIAPSDHTPIVDLITADEKVSRARVALAVHAKTFGFSSNIITNPSNVRVSINYDSVRAGEGMILYASADKSHAQAKDKSNISLLIEELYQSGDAHSAAEKHIQMEKLALRATPSLWPVFISKDDKAIFINERRLLLEKYYEAAMAVHAYSEERAQRRITHFSTIVVNDDPQISR